MKEEDYVNATNLSKLRIAEYTILNLIILPEDKEKHHTVVKLIAEMIDKLEKVVDGE